MSEEDKADWWKGNAKPGNRHRQRRENRKRGHKAFRSLSIVDGHGKVRIHLGCRGGRQPEISLLDRDGNIRLRLALDHGGSYPTENGDGFVSLENPSVVLYDSGKAIRVSIDSLSGETIIRLVDSCGQTEINTFTDERIRTAAEP